MMNLDLICISFSKNNQVIYIYFIWLYTSNCIKLIYNNKFSNISLTQHTELWVKETFALVVRQLNCLKIAVYQYICTKLSSACYSHFHRT